MKSGKVFTIAADPEMEVWQANEMLLEPKETVLGKDGSVTFPAASVTAVEVTTSQD